MKKNALLIAVVAIFLSVTTTSFAQKVAYTAPSIIPVPVQCELSAFDYAPLAKVTIASDDAEAAKWAKQHFALWYKKLAPKVSQVAYTGEDTHKEGYSISITNEGVHISAKHIEGVRYAMQSLRQIAIAGRNTQTVESYIVPIGEIKDYPAMEFRGMHICWFPETQEWEVERLIRLAGYYKFNYVVLEQWGTYESKVAPWRHWKHTPMTKEAIKRLLGIAKDLGITLIPELNIFGHAAFSRTMSAKHSCIDQNPEYMPIFEPITGWNWCLSNPEAKKVINDLIVELLEDYGNPPFFHIGCDEATPPSCPCCKAQPYSKLLLAHINAAHDMLAERGVRTMMWHDMLLKKGDERWKGLVANGSTETSQAAFTLPKDIIICDWYYRKPIEQYNSFSYFKSLGFDLIVCPWKNQKGTISEGKAAHKAGAMGLLGTLWQTPTSAPLAISYITTSGMTWNPSAEIPTYNNKSIEGAYFKTHLREVGWDSNLKEYVQFGIDYHQSPLSTKIQ